MTRGGVKDGQVGGVRDGGVRVWARRRVWAAGALVLALPAGVLVWALWPEPAQQRPRQYREVVACLLTDARGLEGRETGEVWAGMQSASLETLARVQYLSVVGEQTAQNARGFLNSQVQSGCVMIFAVGDVPRAAVELAAADHAATRFVVFGSALPGAGANVSVLALSRSAVHSAVVEQVGHE